MNVELKNAAQAALSMVGQLGRSSTPVVKDRKLPLRTHEPREVSSDFPVLVAGDSNFLKDYGIPFFEAHPNITDVVLTTPQKFQALLVNCTSLIAPWNGALTGASGWKAELIYQMCSKFRSSGIPVYLIKPRFITTPYYRWESVASAIFPGFEDEAEETGNPNSLLWRTLMTMGDSE